MSWVDSVNTHQFIVIFCNYNFIFCYKYTTRINLATNHKIIWSKSTVIISIHIVDIRIKSPYSLFVQIVYSICYHLSILWAFKSNNNNNNNKPNYNLWMNNNAIRFRRSKINLRKKLCSTIEKLVNERGNVNGNEWSFLESRELDEHEEKKHHQTCSSPKLLVLYVFVIFFCSYLRQFDFMFLCNVKELLFPT